MDKSRKDKHFLKKAFYKGGAKAINAFVKENLRYPKEALTNKIEGKVFLRYDINHKGKVIAAKVIQSLGYGCDEEAVRLVKLMEFEVAKNRGVRVTYHKDISINFRLPKPKKAPPVQAPSVQNVHYTITPTKAKTTEKTAPKKKGSSGGYTITIN